MRKRDVKKKKKNIHDDCRPKVTKEEKKIRRELFGKKKLKKKLYKE